MGSRGKGVCRIFVVTIALLFCLFGVIKAHDCIADDGKLRIIAFGAHPDDCEIKAGGVAAMWAARGHHVKFVSVTNGDIGHWNMAGGPLAIRRNEEVQQAAKIFGIVTEVLDIHDGEVMPTLENRKKIVKLIREWNADIVLGPRTNDYHPDHRYTGILLQDAAFMVTVPFFCPDIPHLTKNPVFMYFSDGFQKPNPFAADVAVAIDEVIDKKLDALVGMESQFVERGVSGTAETMPKNEAELQEARSRVRDGFSRRFQSEANRFRDKLNEYYGQDKGSKVQSAEAFEICEYGRRPRKEELKELFPFFDK
ncbi:MAG: PIG-L family deacetylase [Candidatus Latescibacteria bacterium]|nr:PIG-L family deacetylase [Candidatus Latescibacterota bacterium]